MNLRLDSRQGMELDRALADRLRWLGDPGLALDLTKEERQERMELTRDLMAALQRARFPRRKIRIQADAAAGNRETDG